MPEKAYQAAMRACHARVILSGIHAFYFLDKMLILDSRPPRNPLEGRLIHAGMTNTLQISSSRMNDRIGHPWGRNIFHYCWCWIPAKDTLATHSSRLMNQTRVGMLCEGWRRNDDLQDKVVRYDHKKAAFTRFGTPHIICGMANRVREFALLGLSLLLGIVLGVLLLELVFRSNTTLLPRGMAAPLPVDAPLADREYEIHSSDADIFYWEASLVRPPAENQLEARVRWRTDEFGFPNPAPVPPMVDLVILGRSYAMGAQAQNPWPDILRTEAGLRVLNLSQTGAGLGQKWDFFRRFGLPRQPRFVVIEILPPMDILQYGGAEPMVVERVAFPLAQSVLRKLFPPEATQDAGGYIYPLPLEFDGGGTQAVFYSRYLSALTLSAEDWAGSEDWKNFSADLTSMISTIRRDGIVPILLFVPTKETVYVPRLRSASILEPALASAGSWKRTGGKLQWSAQETDAGVVQADAPSAEGLIKELALGQSLCLVDPTDAFWQSIQNGADPFMRYDTHWSAVGHELVADGILAVLHSGMCT